MRELRCIVFTDLEVIRAILLHRRAIRQRVPSGTVSGLAMSREDETAAVLTFRGTDGMDGKLELDRRDVVAALIHYCISKRMPMPAMAEKRLQIVNGQAALIIRLNFRFSGQSALEKKLGVPVSSRQRGLGS